MCIVKVKLECHNTIRRIKIDNFPGKVLYFIDYVLAFVQARNYLNFKIWLDNIITINFDLDETLLNICFVY